MRTTDVEARGAAPGARSSTPTDHRRRDWWRGTAAAAALWLATQTAYGVVSIRTWADVTGVDESLITALGILVQPLIAILALGTGFAVLLGAWLALRYLDVRASWDAMLVAARDPALVLAGANVLTVLVVLADPPSPSAASAPAPGDVPRLLPDVEPFRRAALLQWLGLAAALACLAARLRRSTTATWSDAMAAVGVTTVSGAAAVIGLAWLVVG